MVPPNPWMILPFALLLGAMALRRCSRRIGGCGIMPKSRWDSAR